MGQAHIATALPAQAKHGLALPGPAPRPDPRIHAYRPDLADIALAGRVTASSFVVPVLRSVCTYQSALRAAPDAQAVAVSEILYGEGFALLEESHGWAWGYSLQDGYVGYVPASALGPVFTPTHRIAVPQALLFAKPDIKSPVLAHIPLGARLACGEQQGAFYPLTDGSGFVHTRFVAALESDWAPHPLAVATQFIGTPYQWGGRSYRGIDCSGLVQIALQACGLPCPRDSDMQRAQLGKPVEQPHTGDVVFFPGHVGIMASATELLHANAFWMQTLIEPLADVIARLAPDYEKPVLAIKRL